MDPTSRRALVVHVGVVSFLTLLAAALYRSTLRDLRRLQPSYPSRIVVTVATPPWVFIRAHLLSPIAATMGTIGIGSAAFYTARAKKRQGTLQLVLFTLHSLMMLAFIGVFAWAAYWCAGVFALFGTHLKRTAELRNETSMISVFG